MTTLVLASAWMCGRINWIFEQTEGGIAPGRAALADRFETLDARIASGEVRIDPPEDAKVARHGLRLAAAELRHSEMGDAQRYVRGLTRILYGTIIYVFFFPLSLAIALPLLERRRERRLAAKSAGARTPPTRTP